MKLNYSFNRLNTNQKNVSKKVDRKDIRKYYKRRGDWDWKNPSQMIKDWMKWKRNNA